VLPDQLDAVLAWATIALVIVTGVLAIATIVLAVATIAMARNQSQELDVLRKQVDVTREQVRAHLELRNPRWPSPGELPSATVDYVSGFEGASDVWVWCHCHDDDRRFGKASNTPSPARPDQTTIDPLPDSLKPTWDRYFSNIEDELNLVGDEWWAAVTWLAADKRRHCWMYIQRVHHVQIEERVLEHLGDDGTQRPLRP
jgi:hypothetical protein